MKKKLKKIISMVLVLVMMSGIVVEYGPMTSVKADDGENSETMLQINDEKSELDTVALGKNVFCDRTYTFVSYPTCLEGVEYVRTSLDSGTSVQALKSGWIYVLTNIYGRGNSQAEVLRGLNYERLNVAPWSLWMGSTDILGVYEKYVYAGETLSLDKFAIVFASETQLDFSGNGYTKPDSELAIMKSEDGLSVNNIQYGVNIFSNRTYTFYTVPYFLSGKNYICSPMRNSTTLTLTAEKAGYMYMMTTVSDDTLSQSETLINQGFKEIVVPDVKLYSNQGEVRYLYEKYVGVGDTVTYTQDAIPIFSGELVTGEMAVLEPEDGGQAAKVEPKTRAFTDRFYYLGDDLPGALMGQSFIRGSMTNGATATVTKAGKVYVGVPTNLSALIDTVVADGFTKTTYHSFAVGGLSISEDMQLYEKYVDVGDTITYTKWIVIFYGAIPEEDYDVLAYQNPSTSVVVSNPETGMTDAPEESVYERLFQGIATLERTSNGRLWATWMSGGPSEFDLDNYIIGVYSDDDGKTWTDPAFLIWSPEDDVALHDSALHVLADGSLAVTWASHTNEGGWQGFPVTFISICENPDAENPVWSEPKYLMEGVNANDWTELESGELLSVQFMGNTHDTLEIYSSLDGGYSWTYKGFTRKYGAELCESMIVEMEDGSLRLLTRVNSNSYGILESYSYDGGVNWTVPETCDLVGPCSKFYIGRLSTGELLLVNHYEYSGRNNLTVMLSEDDGETWPYKLLLDDRTAVTYPDVVEAEDGTIYVLYDYDRYSTGQILLTKLTKDDIKAGEFQSDVAQQRMIISKVEWEGAEVSDNMNKIDLSNAMTSASSNYNTANSAHAAFDGNDDTRWCASNNSFPQTLMVDMGEVKGVEKINIKFEQDGEWQYTLRISDDGETWNIYDTNPADIPRQQEYAHEKTASARYVSVEITSGGLNADGYACWASIYEMEILGAEGENYALNQLCMASDSYSYSTTVAAAFDGQYNTKYCASDGSLPQEMKVDLGETYDVGAIYICFEQKSNWDYTLETSLDGVTWETYVASDASAIIEVTETNEAEARYIRLTMNGTTDGAWASVREMEVYSVDKAKENITEDTNGAKIEFCGGSLRMDYTDYDKTSLRFGYKIYLPEGATLNSWSWQYTTTNPNNPVTGKGINKTVNEDGSINANLVITGIPSSYYNLVLTAKMKIEYTLSDGTVCTLEETVVRERSVNQVAENILASEESTQVEKDYATNILE